MHHVSQEAEDDLDSIWLYIAHGSGSIEVATRYVETISNRFAVLANFPGIGRPRGDLGATTRSCSIGNYLILYDVADAHISILRVVHGRRESMLFP